MPVRTVSRKKNIHRANRHQKMVTKLCLFLAARPRRNPSPCFRWSKLLSRSTDLGISKAGEPSSPTFSRTGPLIGTMTFVASRQLSRVLPRGGYTMPLPRKLRCPDGRPGQPERRARDTPHSSSTARRRPSFRVPMELRIRALVLDVAAEVRTQSGRPFRGRTRCARR